MSSDPITESLSDRLISGQLEEGSNDPGTNCRTGHEAYNSPLERAAACEEGAQRLTLLVENLEDSSRCVKLALSAAHAVEQMLRDASQLIEAGRLQPNPVSREALASAYMEIINQIDGIAADAEYNGQNFAAGDVIEVAFGNDGENALRVDQFVLTAASLGLASQQVNFTADAEIVREMMLLEDARNTAATRKIFIEMALSVLENRAEFSKNKAHSLQSASQALTKDGRAHVAIQEIAARRITMTSSAISTPSGIDKGQVKNDNDEAFSKTKAKSQKMTVKIETPVSRDEATSDEKELETEIEELQTLISQLDEEPANELDQFAMELARILDEETYLSKWLKFERGETGVFVAHLAQNYGPELIKKAKASYAEDSTFKSVGDRFMRTYEAGLEDKLSEDPKPTNLIGSCLKTDYGKIYILLARAAGVV